MERREEGTAPQTLDCRSVWWYPHQWSISENLVLDLCLGAFLKVSETSPFGLLTRRPLTSLVSQLNHELCRSEGVASLSHHLVCMAVCFSVKCAVTQSRVGVVIVGIKPCVYCLFYDLLWVSSLTPAFS